MIYLECGNDAMNVQQNDTLEVFVHLACDGNDLKDTNLMELRQTETRT
jgi:hypothetical protein